jgi:hypothetical protein
LTGDQLVTWPPPAHSTVQTQHKGTHTSMPQEEFEPTIPVFERAKAVHALDRAATMISHEKNIRNKNKILIFLKATILL